MKVKIITETETLFDMEMPERLTDEIEEQLIPFNERPIVSTLIEYTEGKLVQDTHDLGELEPKDVQQMTIKIK